MKKFEEPVLEVISFISEAVSDPSMSGGGTNEDIIGGN